MILPEGWEIVTRVENFSSTREKPWAWWNEGEYDMDEEKYGGHLWIGLGPDNEALADDHPNYGAMQHGPVCVMGIAVLVNIGREIGSSRWLRSNIDKIVSVAEQLRGSYMSPDQKRIADTIEELAATEDT